MMSLDSKLCELYSMAQKKKAHGPLIKDTALGSWQWFKCFVPLLWPLAVVER